jgi:hypothetical protein
MKSTADPMLANMLARGRRFLVGQKQKAETMNKAYVHGYHPHENQRL